MWNEAKAAAVFFSIAAVCAAAAGIAYQFAPKDADAERIEACMRMCPYGMVPRYVDGDCVCGGGK